MPASVYSKFNHKTFSALLFNLVVKHWTCKTCGYNKARTDLIKT